MKCLILKSKIQIFCKAPVTNRMEYGRKANIRCTSRYICRYTDVYRNSFIFHIQKKAYLG